MVATNLRIQTSYRKNVRRLSEFIQRIRFFLQKMQTCIEEYKVLYTSVNVYGLCIILKFFYKNNSNTVYKQDVANNTLSLVRYKTDILNNMDA